eukprot:9104119-Pyramimonas_sp.AAC.1
MLHCLVFSESLCGPCWAPELKCSRVFNVLGGLKLAPVHLIGHDGTERPVRPGTPLSKVENDELEQDDDDADDDDDGDDGVVVVMMMMMVIVVMMMVGTMLMMIMIMMMMMMTRRR